ncbi:MAG: radical SAM family heme chaperone HemW [Campylobacter sp.]|nr:radical SAM family heme chaperone HemW [Campylobacter sp.]
MLLYVHIAFCKSKCPYCAFGSVTDKNELKKDYFKALIKDFKNEVSIHNIKAKSIQSVFFGGGTPSACDAGLYEDLFYEISPYLDDDCEITSEANPNSASLDWLKQMRNFGVNRISFGAQSFDEKKLKFLGRIHGKKEIYDAVQNARISGFDNINLDIIYASKFDTKKLLITELENLEILKPDHVSAYSLTLEPNTKFYNKNHYVKDSPILAKFFIDQICKLGLKQYEISNFGRICKHNLGYWQRKQYLGIGAFSIGCINNVRYYAKEDIKLYLKQTTKKRREFLSKEDLHTEMLFLGARSCVGIPQNELNLKEYKNAEILRQNGKLRLENGRYILNNFLIADEIVLFITN